MVVNVIEISRHNILDIIYIHRHVWILIETYLQYVGSRCLPRVPKVADPFYLFSVQSTTPFHILFISGFSGPLEYKMYARHKTVFVTFFSFAFKFRRKTVSVRKVHKLAPFPRLGFIISDNKLYFIILSHHYLEFYEGTTLM